MTIQQLSPIEPLAKVDLLAQTAAVSASTIFTPAISGRYLLEIYLKLTTVAATSSGLGPVTITFTDADDSTSPTIIACLFDQTGTATSAANENNTTAAKLMGTVIVNALAGQPIKWAIAYSSSSANTMAYSAQVTVRAA